MATTFQTGAELAEQIFGIAADRSRRAFELGAATPVVFCQTTPSGGWEYDFKVWSATRPQPLLHLRGAEPDSGGQAVAMYPVDPAVPADDVSLFRLCNRMAEPAAEKRRIRIEMEYSPSSKVYLALEAEARAGAETTMAVAGA